jgi:hypothetical protein
MGVTERLQRVMLAEFVIRHRCVEGYDVEYEHRYGERERAHFDHSEWFAMIDWLRIRGLSKIGMRRLIERAEGLHGLPAKVTDSCDHPNAPAMVEAQPVDHER